MKTYLFSGVSRSVNQPMNIYHNLSDWCTRCNMDENDEQQPPQALLLAPSYSFISRSGSETLSSRTRCCLDASWCLSVSLLPELTLFVIRTRLQDGGRPSEPADSHGDLALLLFPLRLRHIPCNSGRVKKLIVAAMHESQTVKFGPLL